MANRTLQDSQSVAANSTVNVLAGKRYENLGTDTLASLFASGSAAGLRMEFFSGNRAVVESSAVSTANRLPQLEDLIIENFPGYAGEKLQLNVINTTSGALTFFYRLDFDDEVIRSM
jgi:hypothetical protein